MTPSTFSISARIAPGQLVSLDESTCDGHMYSGNRAWALEGVCACGLQRLKHSVINSKYMIALLQKVPFIKAFLLVSFEA